MRANQLVARALGAICAQVLRRISAANEVEMGGQAVARLCGLLGRSSPVAFLYYQEDVVPFVTAALQPRDTVVRQIVERTEWLHDDTIGGVVCGELISRVGGRARMLPWAHQGRRIATLQRLMRNSRWTGLAVDSHGLRRSVQAGLPRMLSATQALAIPLAAAVDRSRVVRMGADVVIPKRRARIVVEIGEPVACGIEPTILGEMLSDRLRQAKVASEHALDRMLMQLDSHSEVDERPVRRDQEAKLRP